MEQILRPLLFVVGTLSVALGVLGIVLPLLPTTPFLLLAAFCYGRSSKRFYHWLLTNRWFGAYISNYREGRRMLRREKILTLTLLWLTIGCTATLAVSAWWVQLLLAGIAVGVTIHLLRLKTCDAPVSGRLTDEPPRTENLGLDSE